MFTKKQRKALTKISMSRIICDATGIDLLSRDAFKFSSSTKDYVRCKTIPQVDLKPWKEQVKGTRSERISQTPQPNITVPVHLTIKLTNTAGLGWLKAES